ncbi:hypothetical protein, partial [Roseibium aggregatum]|uniref:hypothetical protein n=1 Tax=Roseibium aggregatum TaxID=187304 RepID=UPI003A975AA8
PIPSYLSESRNFPLRNKDFFNSIGGKLPFAASCESGGYTQEEGIRARPRLACHFESNAIGRSTNARNVMPAT